MSLHNVGAACTALWLIQLCHECGSVIYSAHATYTQTSNTKVHYMLYKLSVTLILAIRLVYCKKMHYAAHLDTLAFHFQHPPHDI